MKTNELRACIKARLETLRTEALALSVYYKQADPEAMYPHIVFSLSSADLTDWNRSDYTLDVDVYTLLDPELMEDLADQIEEIFRENWNDPQSTILPTFYLLSRSEIEDPNKDIRRTTLRLDVHLYERSVSEE